MSDREEGYVIIERRTGSFGTFVWGLLLGAGAALLFAPKTGRETRRELTDSLYRMRDRAETKVREVQTSVTETVDDVRRQFEDGVDQARRAVESGKQAARTSRAEMERRVRDSAAAFRSGYDAARGPGTGGATPGTGAAGDMAGGGEAGGSGPVGDAGGGSTEA